MAKYPAKLIIHGMRQSWRQVKRHGIQIAKRLLKKPSPRPRTRFAGATIPQAGTAFSDRFMPAGQAASPMSSQVAGHE